MNDCIGASFHSYWAICPCYFDKLKYRMIMNHPICQMRTVEIVELFTLRVQFTDDKGRLLKVSLAGGIYGSLLDPKLFNQVTVDPEVKTLVWPNVADFDPATLHDWPKYKEAVAARAREWERVSA